MSPHYWIRRSKAANWNEGSCQGGETQGIVPTSPITFAKAFFLPYRTDTLFRKSFSLVFLSCPVITRKFCMPVFRNNHHSDNEIPNLYGNLNEEKNAERVHFSRVKGMIHGVFFFFASNISNANTICFTIYLSL